MAAAAAAAADGRALAAATRRMQLHGQHLLRRWARRHAPAGPRQQVGLEHRGLPLCLAAADAAIMRSG